MDTLRTNKQTQTRMHCQHPCAQIDWEKSPRCTLLIGTFYRIHRQPDMPRPRVSRRAHEDRSIFDKPFIWPTPLPYLTESLWFSNPNKLCTLCLLELRRVFCSLKRRQNWAQSSQTGRKKNFAMIAKLEVVHLHRKPTQKHA